MRSSTSGLLLLLIGALALIGFLTGNLDRWLGYLFGAGGAVSTTVAPAAASSYPGGTVAISTNNQRTGAHPAGVA